MAFTFSEGFLFRLNSITSLSSTPLLIFASAKLEAESETTLSQSPSLMSTEQILKLQPDRTLYLRGFDGTGAAASLCQTSPTGFTVNGVFRDMADFCVLVVYDADNTFEHYSVRYLPSFDLSGMVLNFDLSYQGLQPIDSAKFSWIDWAQLDVIDTTGEPKLASDQALGLCHARFRQLLGGARNLHVQRSRGLYHL